VAGDGRPIDRRFKELTRSRHTPAGRARPSNVNGCARFSTGLGSATRVFATGVLTGRDAGMPK
jgi:hypothetical protein